MNYPNHQIWNYCEYLGNYKGLDLGICINPDCINEATVFGDSPGDYYSGELIWDNEIIPWVFTNSRRKEVLFRAIAWRII